MQLSSSSHVRQSHSSTDTGAPALTETAGAAAGLPTPSGTNNGAVFVRPLIQGSTKRVLTPSKESGDSTAMLDGAKPGTAAAESKAPEERERSGEVQGKEQTADGWQGAVDVWRERERVESITNSFSVVNEIEQCMQSAALVPPPSLKGLPPVLSQPALGIGVTPNIVSTALEENDVHSEWDAISVNAAACESEEGSERSIGRASIKLKRQVYICQ